MNITRQQEEKYLPVPEDKQRIKVLLSKLHRSVTAARENENAYYDEMKDRKAVECYYRGIDMNHDSMEELQQSLSQLLQETHTRQVRYNPAEYVYPWVDLRPDGTLTNVYSGEKRNAEEVIKEDADIAARRRTAMENESDDEQAPAIAAELKFNCEHAVPQSWFGEKEPMRGDIHHLFTCEPVCNSIRSNYPYYDFEDYTPGSIDPNRVEKACGKAEKELFEPEHGKGPAARAMLYFLLRYPEEIDASYSEAIDVELLQKWHKEFPPDLYEKHRNQAIFEIQGNRNPFIDFPDKHLMTKV
ncbi:endonuclease I family protein [Alteribacillus sp. HJP-4]|uniref:endonuclease I family protein n=1 Tax=Alteribacillus sp. HJP-4 TaxID=2775394 RepID=UPI0035CD24AE